MKSGLVRLFAKLHVWVPFLWCLTGCSAEQKTPIPWLELNGRDRSVTRPLYRMRVPLDYRRVDPDQNADLSDTTLPIATFYVDEDALRVTIHTFPYTDPKTRIPPQQQVARWQRQYPQEKALITPLAHGGFHGLFFESSSALGWSMKIADPYEEMLATHLTSTAFTRALRADYTIKAVGSAEALSKHKETLQACARSFEWIEEMPCP